MNWSWHNTDQVRVSLRLIYFYRSYCPLLKFSGLFSAVFWDIDFKFKYMNLSGRNTDQVPVSSRLTYFYRSYCPFLKFSFPDFSLQSFEILTSNLNIWICHDIIQIKFQFCHAWLSFTGIIAHSLNLVFRTFLCSLLRYWLQIWSINLSWHNTDQVWVPSCLTYCYRSYCPFLKFSFPDFSLQSFEILT